MDRPVLVFVVLAIVVVGGAVGFAAVALFRGTVCMNGATLNGQSYLDAMQQRVPYTIRTPSRASREWCLIGPGALLSELQMPTDRSVSLRYRWAKGRPEPRSLVVSQTPADPRPMERGDAVIVQGVHGQGRFQSGTFSRGTVQWRKDGLTITVSGEFAEGTTFRDLLVVAESVH